MTESCMNCACYEEEWEYCFRLGTHVLKDGYCENYGYKYGEIGE